MSEDLIDVAADLAALPAPWASCRLGGVCALEIEWRLSRDKSEAVDWRLHKHAGANRKLVADGTVSRDLKLQRIDLMSVYHDPNISHGEVGLRFEHEGMAFWCNIPLSPSSWVRETLEVWLAPRPDDPKPPPPPPDPFDPPVDDLGHRAVAWGASVTPEPAATPILDFLWLDAPPALAAGSDRFIGYDESGLSAANLPLCQSLAKARSGAADPAAALAAMQQAAQAAVTPLPAAQQTLAAQVVAFLELAIAGVEIDTLAGLDALAFGVLDQTPKAFVTAQVTPGNALFAAVWQQLYALSLAPAADPTGATCPFFANVARGMTLLIGLANDNAALADPEVRARLGRALLRLAPAVRPPPPAGASTSCVGVGAQKVIEQTFEGYRRGEIAEVLSLLPGEKLTLVDRQRTRAVQTEDERQDRLDRADRAERDTVASDLAQSLRDALGQDEIIRDYTGLTFDENAWPEMAVSGSWWGQDGRQTRDLARAATFAQALSRRAASRISERVERSRASVLTREQEATQTRSIDHRQGQGALNGAYYWLERVDHLRLRTVGRRLVLEMLLDDPARTLLGTVEALPHLEPPLPPSTWTISTDPAQFSTVTAGNYASAAAAYGLDLPPPPPAGVTVRARLDQQARAATLDIPPGYSAASVSLSYLVADDALTLNALIGATPVSFTTGETTLVAAPAPPVSPSKDLVARSRPGADDDEPTPPPPPPIPDPQTFTWTSPAPGAGQGTATFAGGLTGPTPVVCQYDGAVFSAVAEAQCAPISTAPMTAWQVAAHGEILRAYDTLRQRHARAVRDALLTFSAEGVGRTLERALTLDGLTALGASAPRTTAALTASEARLLSEALDWACASYAFYPWDQAANPGGVNIGFRTGEVTSDRNAPAWLDTFLVAGSARMLVTVRPGFETAVLFFLAMGYFPAPASAIFVTELGAALLTMLETPAPAELEHDWRLATPTNLLALSTTLDLLPGGDA